MPKGDAGAIFTAAAEGKTPEGTQEIKRLAARIPKGEQKEEEEQVKKPSSVGYHAGDLGKAEYLFK